MNLPRFGVGNPVFVNLLMWALLLGGLFFWFNLVRELLPNFEPEQTVVTVIYPGATPDEVEKAVALPLEREIENLRGLDEMQTEILEGRAAVRLTLIQGADRDRFLNDLRSEVDRVQSDLPDGAEDPDIEELRPIFPVISVVVFGDVNEARLRDAALDVRDELLLLPEISELTVSGVREREIVVEIQPERLEEYGLTFDEVGRAVAAGNLDLPGGQLESSRGNVRVRTLGEEDQAAQLEGLVVRARPDGSAVHLRDVAVVRDGFEDKVEAGRWKTQPGVLITVYKTPEQDAIAISERVKAFVADAPTRFGGAVSLETTSDTTRLIEQRIDLMVSNATLGFLLVCVALALFLNLRVAIWVAMGLAVSFMGTFICMRLFGVSINLISLFGMIVVLGLLVDDAIVIGENVFTKLRAGLSPAEAAIEGTNEMKLPVLAAVITSVVAFAPLYFIAGRLGAFLSVLPVVVVSALSMSLLEAFIILPGHLGHGGERDGEPRFAITRKWARFQEAKDHWIEERLAGLLERVLRFLLHWRYAALAASATLFFLVAGLVAGGIVPFRLFQQFGAETVVANLEMASGTPQERTAEVLAEIERAVLQDPEVDSVFTVIGSSFGERGRQSAADPAAVGQLTIQLTPADERQERGERESSGLAAAWRDRTAALTGVRKLTFTEQAGGPRGADIEVRVRGEDAVVLDAAVRFVRDELGRYDGVGDIEDDLREGKLEARLRLRESARALGLTTRELATQMRHAFFGFEAQDLQTEDGEVTIRVVLPKAARRDLSDLDRLRISTPSGARVPLSEVAELDMQRGYAALSRVDGRRAVTVKADVDEDKANIKQVTDDVSARIADIGHRFPGVDVSFEGRRKETTESVGSLRVGFSVALLVIYSILAILFRSYSQPFLVMAAIPYALVGAVIGHLVLGLSMSLLSLIGVVALAGIVVNDSLILVDFINRARRSGMSAVDAIVLGARARMRAILLTSITTILGIAPLMLETSFQAQFLIPMAVSIVFGLAFATVITLILLPTLYLVGADLLGISRWLLTGRWNRKLNPAATSVLPEA